MSFVAIFAPLLRAFAGNPPSTILAPKDSAILQVLSVELLSATIISKSIPFCFLIDSSKNGNNFSSLNVGIIILNFFSILNNHISFKTNLPCHHIDKFYFFDKIIL